MATIKGNCEPTLITNGPVIATGNGVVASGCSPQQSLPQPLNGIVVSPTNITWTPTTDASCMQNAGITNLADWLGWVERNVIKSFCSVKSSSCQIGVSQAAASGGVEIVGKTVSQALVDCLGLSATKPHILFDATANKAIAGRISTPVPDCTEFNNLLGSCPSPAADAATPDMIIGFKTDAAATNGVVPHRYPARTTRPSRFFGTLPINLSSNRFTGIVANQRLVPQGMTPEHNQQGDDQNNPGSAFSYLIGTDGFYDISCSLMINTVYTSRTAWILTHMMGVLVTKANGSTAEYRLDEAPIYLNYTTPSGQDVTLTGAIGLDLEAGDSIQIRAWHNDTTLSSNGYSVTKWFNKSATTHLSVIRRIDRSLTIQG